MNSLVCMSVLSLLLPTVSYSGNIYRSASAEYQNDYPGLDDYDEAHYNDISEKEADEENIVERADSTPVFVTSPKTFVVNEGDAIKLPCNVDNLENLLIIWKRGNRIIALGNKPYEDDDSRVKVEDTANGNTLVIRLSEEKDAGEYVCQVSAAQPVELKHTVKIVVRPEVKSIPQSGLIKVKSGESAELGCKVTRGSPEPDVVWKRKERPMPSGEKTLSGLSIIFPKTSRHHSGIYTCYADNGWRSPATATIRLDVQHSPEIEQEMMTVRNKEESDIKITCTIHASPIPTVEWYKNGERLMVKDNVISKRGNRHTLLLTEKLDKTGRYECKATNDLGEASAGLEVTGDGSYILQKFEELERTQETGNKVKEFVSTEDVKVIENVYNSDSVDDDQNIKGDMESNVAENIEIVPHIVLDSTEDVKEDDLGEASAALEVTGDDSNILQKFEEIEHTQENGNKVKEFDSTEDVKVIENVYNSDAVDDDQNIKGDMESNVAEHIVIVPHIEGPVSESLNSDNDDKIPDVTTSESSTESHKPSKSEKLMDTSNSIKLSGQLYLFLLQSVICTLWL